MPISHYQNTNILYFEPVTSLPTPARPVERFANCLNELQDIEFKRTTINFIKELKEFNANKQLGEINEKDFTEFICLSDDAKKTQI